MSETISVRGLVVDEKKVFAVSNRWVPDKYRVLPGGSVESGESLHDALQRELVEELGVEPEIGNLVAVQQLRQRDGRHSGPIFIFHITNYQDFRSVDPASTTHGADEIGDYGFESAADRLLPVELAGLLSELERENYQGPARFVVSEVIDK